MFSEYANDKYLVALGGQGKKKGVHVQPTRGASTGTLSILTGGGIVIINLLTGIAFIAGEKGNLSHLVNNIATICPPVIPLDLLPDKIENPNLTLIINIMMQVVWGSAITFPYTTRTNNTDSIYLHPLLDQPVMPRLIIL